MLTLTSSKDAKSGAKNSRNTTDKEAAPEDSRSQLWTEKYKPKRVADLPVHHSKVRAMKDWLEKSLEIHECYFDLGASGPTCFLAVCGNSGCGKTSTVQQVCAEFNVHILEWSNDLWDAETCSTIHWGDDNDRGGATSGSYVNSNYSKSYQAQYGGGYSHTAQDLFKVEGVTWAAYTSKGDALESFAVQSSYPSLALQTKPNNNNSNTTSSSNYHSHNSKNVHSSGEVKRNTHLSHTLTENSQTASISNTQPIPTTTTTTTSNTSTSAVFQRKILLLKDPPGYLDRNYSSDSHQRRQNLYNFLLSVQCPVVMVLSDVSGRDDFAFTVDRCLPQQIKQRLQFESVYFTPVTENKVAKVLDSILKQERIERSSKYTSQLVQDISSSCMGDIRHAVVQLQLLLGNNIHQHSNKPVNVTRSTTSNTTTKPEHIQRSQSLPTAKHTTTNNSNNSNSSNTSNNKHTIPLHSESTIYDNLPTNTQANTKANKRHKTNNNHMEIVDLISPPTSPAAHSITINNKYEDNVYVSLAPSARRSKRVVYDSEDEDGGVSIRDSANNNSSVNSIHRGVSDGALTSHTTTNTNINIELPSISSPTSTVSAIHATLQIMSKRDGTFSSMHSVGKLLRATLDNQGKVSFDPDAVIERSELSVDLIHAFMQWNWIGAVESTPRIYPPITTTMSSDRKGHSEEHILDLTDDVTVDNVVSTVTPPAEHGSESDIALKQLHELETALALFSEVDIYNTRKYDTNANIDRSGTSLYPDGYIKSILSRSACVSRGNGSSEHMAYAKSRGFKGSFQGIYRPKAIDLRAKMSAVQGKLRVIQNELLHLSPTTATHTTSTSKSHSSGTTGQKQHYSGALPHNTPYITPYTAPYASNTITINNLPSDECSSALLVPLRELLLHTIPYHRTITHYISESTSAPLANSNISSALHTLPVYTEKLDWMMHNLYNTSQLFSASAGRNSKDIGSSAELLAAAGQAEDGSMDDIISEFD